VNGEVSVIPLSGDVDVTRAPTLRLELMQSVGNRDAGLVIDMTNVTYLDSAGVNVVFEVADALRQHQLRLAVVIPPESLVERVVTLVNLGSVAAVERDLEAALAHVKQDG
jgi:anti-anti-sigma factor